ncbi:sensor histidine kinase [Rarobacter incanus]|uniref:histidine kinase n=1 Tax=Rarobacter incanus TaxID=153494 RepID=A0A542SNW6_9MICO|nr:HAMP domain-containing sensor histidine kinase [Rarobacter incanus]TQK76326.1 two-component system OmpR family sensor kinase [Rarobacter incanus]
MDFPGTPGKPRENAAATPATQPAPPAAPAEASDGLARFQPQAPHNEAAPPGAGAAGELPGGAATPQGPGRAGDASANDAPERGGATAGSTVTTLRRAWARVPLRIRLVSVITLLLVCGIGAVGTFSTMQIERLLQRQIDERLFDNATSLYNRGEVASLEAATGTNPLPTDYCFALVIGTQPSTAQSQYLCAKSNVAANGIPSLDGAPISTTGLTTAFTTRGITPPGGTKPTLSTPTWRVVGIPLQGISDAHTADMAYVALPLTYAVRTGNQVRVAFVLTTMAIALAGAVFGYFAVRTSLKPLRRIEATAARIAEGDLSARVPAMPQSTEVGSLGHSLNVMLSQIEAGFDARERSEASMRQFVSDASHELRTPLATIRGYGELYHMGALTSQEAMDDTMRRIEDSSRRMGMLVEDLLALARLDEGRALRHDPVDLFALARDGAMDLGALDATRSVRVTALDGSDIDPGDALSGRAVVIGDEDRLRQVVMNLVGNAVRHTPTGTAVELGVGTRGDMGVILVRDHGPGVSADQLPRLFERFYRADSSRDRRSGGSGLGLSIVAAIAASLGGCAAASNTPGGGLTIEVELPLATS